MQRLQTWSRKEVDISDKIDECTQKQMKKLQHVALRNPFAEGLKKVTK